MKKIIKNFNNLVKRTIFKVQNKTNNNFNISNFSKFLITLIVSLFICLFYLLIPHLYDKMWVQANIQSELLNEFKINLSKSSNVSYRILPAPHFLIKDSKLLMEDIENQKSIAEIKNFKVFLSNKNFFIKEKVKIKKIIIDEANFTLLQNDLKILNELKDKKFSNNKIKISNSNFFFKDNLNEIILIVKIDKADLFFDAKKLFNIFNLKGEVFNMPFNLNFMNNSNPNKYTKINFNSKLLKLDILNEFFVDKNGLINGSNIISFLNSTINTKYNIKEKLLNFESDNSRLNKLQLSYDGKLSINPFDLDLDIKLNDYKISKLFNVNSILVEFLKSKLLFNDNISIGTSISVNSESKNEIFNNGKINFNIINGNANFDKTRLINNKIGSLEVINSKLSVENDELFLNTDISFDIKNYDNLFAFFSTNKKSRKEIKYILVNLDYNFLNNQVVFNSIKIDNQKFSDKSLKIINDFNDVNYENFHKQRLLVGKLLNLYDG